MDELLAYTERRTRAELAALPHGVYEAEGFVDNDGYTDEPVRLQARVELVARTACASTSTGSDPQRRAPVNSTYAQTFSACAYALKCLIDPDLPVNDGFYRLIDVDAPAGTVVNCTLARAGRRRLGDARRASSRCIFRALLPAFPERLPAGTKAMMCQAGFGALDVATADVHVLLRHVRRRLRRALRERRPRRGAGARPEHRERADRGDRAQLPGADPDGSRWSRTPRAPGRFRGGLGLRKDYLFDRPTTFTILADRDRFGPWGAFGGHDGRRRRVRPRSATARDAARLEDDGRARARRRDQRPHLRRRRLRPARGARPGARPARRARGQGERRARARPLPRRDRATGSVDATQRREELRA